MNSLEYLNQNYADVEDSVQIVGTKIQNEQWKTLMESNNDIKKSLHDLKNLVMSQSEDKSQNVQGIETINNCDNAEELNFEPPTKRIKLEGQSEEIQRLNQIIEYLKEDNLKLSNMNAKLVSVNDHFVKVQQQNEAAMKDLKRSLETIKSVSIAVLDLEEKNLKLQNEIDALKLKHGSS